MVRVTWLQTMCISAESKHSDVSCDFDFLQLCCIVIPHSQYILLTQKQLILEMFVNFVFAERDRTWMLHLHSPCRRCEPSAVPSISLAFCSVCSYQMTMNLFVAFLWRKLSIGCWFRIILFWLPARWLPDEACWKVTLQVCWNSGLSTSTCCISLTRWSGMDVILHSVDVF